MRRVSIKEYAVANKISIFNVIKMAKNGTLKTETQKSEGKEELFILLDEGEKMQEKMENSAPNEKIEDYQKAYLKLKIKYDQLQIKFDRLQKTVSDKEC